MTRSVDIVLPVHNAAGMLRDAIASIQRQSMPQWTLWIVDDGSTDSSRQVAAHQALSDKRIHVLEQDHSGISKALNRGVAAGRGEFVARMDADDFAHPDRLAKQVAFMGNHPEVGVCGGSARLVGSSRGSVVVPHSPDAIRARLLFGSAFVHPTVMFRRSLLLSKQVFLSAYDGVEDYQLWTRLARQTQLANLPDVLLDYRMHGAQSTAAGPTRRLALIRQVQSELLQSLGERFSADDIRAHALLGTDAQTLTDATVSSTTIENWLGRLGEAVIRNQWCSQHALQREFRAAWWRHCARTSTASARDYWRSVYREPTPRGWLRVVRLWFRERGGEP